MMDGSAKSTNNITDSNNSTDVKDASSSLSPSDVPYDLLLDDELNSFFDNDNESGDVYFPFNNGEIEFIQDEVPLHDQEKATTSTTTTAIGMSQPDSTIVGNMDDTTNPKSQKDIDISQALTSEMKEPLIDGRESTLSWHNEQLDKVHRQSMIRLM
jgi:hypothetical protein